MPSKKRSPAGAGGRKRQRSLQAEELLGAVLDKEDYRSSEDEDYAPDQRASARAGGRQPPTTPTRSAAAAAGGDGGGGDEETPLSERRRQLLLQRQRQAGSKPPPAGSAHHLPVEVIARILRLAYAGNAVPTVAAAACVNRTWRAAVEQHPQLWHSLDLSIPRCRVSDAVVTRQATRRWSHLQRLSLSGCNNLTDASLKALAQHCPRLTQLDLSYCTCFSEAGLTAALSIMLQRRAADGAQPLRRLNLSCIQVKPRASGIDQLLRQVLLLQSKNADGPVLEELLMEGCPLLTHQGLRAICDASFEQRRPLLGALRTLRLTQSAGARNTFAIHIERLQYACPCLEELGLNGLGGRWGWAFNLTTPGAMPWYLPTERIGLAATAEATLASLGDGHHKRQQQQQQQQGAGRAGPGPGVPTAAEVTAAVAAAAAAAAAGDENEQEEGSGAAAGGSSGGLRLLYHSAGFPRLRVCEVGTTILHSEGQLSGRSLIHDGALARLLHVSPRLEQLDLSGLERLTFTALMSALHHAAPLRRVVLSRSGACCDGAVGALVQSHGATLEEVGLGWGGSKVTDFSALGLAAACPRLAILDLAGTAVTEEGVQLLVGAAVERGTIGRLQLDISSCRGVGREVRQAASQGMAQLRAVLGL